MKVRGIERQSPDNLARIRQKLAALPSDSARVNALIDLAAAAGKDNLKLALTFLDDARNIVSKRAVKYPGLLSISSELLRHWLR